MELQVQDQKTLSISGWAFLMNPWWETFFEYQLPPPVSVIFKTILKNLLSIFVAKYKYIVVEKNDSCCIKLWKWSDT